MSSEIIPVIYIFAPDFSTDYIHVFTHKTSGRIHLPIITIKLGVLLTFEQTINYIKQKISLKSRSQLLSENLSEISR